MAALRFTLSLLMLCAAFVFANIGGGDEEPVETNEARSPAGAECVTDQQP